MGNHGSYSAYSAVGAVRRPGGDPPHELKEFCHAESTATRRDRHEGIHGDRVRPRRGQRVETARRIGEPDAVLAPILTVGDQVKLVLVERMVRVGDTEPSRRNVTMRRS